MKKRQLIYLSAMATLILTAAVASNSFGPGSRIVILSHNAYPDHGKYANRLDRAIAAGLPFATEQDLAWIDGRSWPCTCGEATTSAPAPPTYGGT